MVSVFCKCEIFLCWKLFSSFWNCTTRGNQNTGNILWLPDIVQLPFHFGTSFLGRNRDLTILSTMNSNMSVSQCTCMVVFISCWAVLVLYCKFNELSKTVIVLVRIHLRVSFTCLKRMPFLFTLIVFYILIFDNILPLYIIYCYSGNYLLIIFTVIINSNSTMYMWGLCYFLVVSRGILKLK